MDAIICDQSRERILVLQFTRVPSDQEFAGYLQQLDAALDRRQKYVVVLDVQTKETMPRPQRRQQAEWMKRRRDDLQRYCAGTAFVFRSGVHRFVLSTIFLVQPIPTPYEICATLDDALAWARLKLA